jgi:AraC family transcriptional regulator, transcriptional activator of pobA
MKNIPIRQINRTKTPSDPSEGFNIRNIRDLLAGNDMIHELHRHNFFFILVLEKGKGNHEIDFNLHKIRNNSVFFLRPGQVHRLKLNAESTGYLMEFKTDYFYHHDNRSKQLLRGVSNSNFYQFDANGSKKLLAILDFIFQEYKNKADRYHEVIKANLRILLIELDRNRNKQKDYSGAANTYIQERLEAFFELLELHISKQKKVSQYASMLNLSVYQLNAITRTLQGKTCSALINEYIVLESKRYLLATSNQVNQIAYYLGYEDISYFIRFFKKHTGYSPEAFRNKFR